MDVIFAILLIGLAVFQSNRNHCYWHGRSQGGGGRLCDQNLAFQHSASHRPMSA
jgi:hypothetical protein